MNLKGLLIITCVAVAVIVLFKIFWDGSGKEMKSGQADSLTAGATKSLKSGSGEAVTYGESVADAPTPAKFVQIQPMEVADFNHHVEMIDALGYREVRVFVHLSAKEYRTNPLPKEALLTVGFGHELAGMGTGYGGATFKREATSYIEGFVTEKIYGKKLKLVIDADNLPKGKYTLQLTYYLLP
jgi:hypothetical protein